MINKIRLAKNYFLLLVILLAPISVQATEYLSENWDIGTPPADFPCWESECGDNHTWRGWEETGSTHHEEGNECELSTSIYHSPPRSLHQVRSANQYRVMNQQHSIPGNPTKIHMRFYVYFTNNWLNFAQDSEFVHLIFFNTAAAGVGFRINLRHHVSNGWPYECNGGMFLAFQDGPTEGEHGTAPDPCFDIKDHLEEWICFEIMADASADKVSLWINGTQYIDEANMPISRPTFDRVIISGYSSYLRDCTWDYYMDDIVIADSYIGPMEENEQPAPPQNLRVIE